MTRRSLFKSVFGGIAALFVPKLVCSKAPDLPDISPTISSSSNNSQYFYYMASDGRMYRIFGEPNMNVKYYSGAYSFWDDPLEDIYTFEDGEPV